MGRADRGMTALELMLVVGIAAIVIGLATPSALTALKGYRLHSDASAIAGYLNLVRMRAASQYAPYRLDLDPTARTYVIEELSPITYNPLGTPTTSTYTPQSPPVYEYGTQYLSQGNTMANCRPSGISAYPGPLTADASSCTGAFQLYFNTRGVPVDSSGSQLTNGGLAVYLTGQNGLVDAVTISSGGAIQVWNWSPGSAKWLAR